MKTTKERLIRDREDDKKYRTTFMHCSRCFNDIEPPNYFFEDLKGKERVCEECFKKVDKAERDQYVKEIQPFYHSNEEIVEKRNIPTIISELCDLYNERRCFGYRYFDGKVYDRYQYFSFNEVGKICQSVVSYLHSLKLMPTDPILLCCDTCIERFLIQFALYSGGYLCCMLTNVNKLSYIKGVYEKCKFKAMFISKYFLGLVEEEFKDIPIISVDDCYDRYEEHYESKKKFVTFQKIMKYKSKIDHIPNIDLKQPMLLVSSSGSTGEPKLITYLHSTLLDKIKKEPTVGVYYMFLYFQPFDILGSFASGICLLAYSGSIQRVREDILLSRPNSISSTPSFYNSLYNEYKYMKSKDPEMTIEKYRKLYVLGDRCRIVSVGGAKCSDELKAFLNGIVTWVYDGYGTSETGSITCLDNENEVKSEIILIDCPEMGYFTNGNPPRGEIVARTQTMSDGYYNDEVKTNESFVTIDGKKYFKTGDIGEMVNGKIKIIDRKAFSIKTSQAVFIMPSVIETFIEQLDCVDQAYVFGNINVPFICAVVHCNNLDDDDLLTTIQKYLKEKKLSISEIPQKLVISKNGFTIKNGFLLGNGKINRSELLKHYKHYIFEEGRIIIEGKEQQEVDVNEESMISKDLENILRMFVPSLVHIKNINSVVNQQLSCLGVDSIVMSQITSFINTKFNLNLQVRQLYQMESILQIHRYTQHEDIVSHSIDWNEELKRLIEDVQSVAKKPLKQNNGNKILITGASGFVGKFALRSICEQLDNNVICLVRNKSKLLKVFEEVCRKELFDKYVTKITILEGDQTKNEFGLKSDEYNSLLEDIKIVINCCGRAHMYESYSQLYPFNVESTVNILKFCNSNNSQLIHISSQSALPPNGYDEKEIIPTNHLNSNTGYCQSKWMSDQLIVKSGLTKRTIIRLGLAGFDRKTGICNEQDLLTPFYKNVFEKGIICYDSTVFYSNSLPIIPVDLVANSIVLAINEMNKSGNNLHVYNAGCSKWSPLKQLFSELPLKEVDVQTFRETISTSIRFGPISFSNDNYVKLVGEVPIYTSENGKTLFDKIKEKYLSEREK